MDRNRRRGYIIGYSVGLNQNKTNKETIQQYFSDHYAVENCDEACPFASECNRMIEATSNKLCLCNIILNTNIEEADKA